MRARLRAEGEDQRHQSAASGDRVCQQGETDVSDKQALGHDPRPDHADQQKRVTASRATGRLSAGRRSAVVVDVMAPVPPLQRREHGRSPRLPV